MAINSLSNNEFKALLLKAFTQGQNLESVLPVADLESITDNTSIDQDSLLLVSNSTQCHLVTVDVSQSVSDTIRLFDLAVGKPLKPIPFAKWNSALQQKKVLLAKPKNATPPQTVPATATPNSEEQRVNEAGVGASEKTPLVSETAERDKILDTGAFSQLVEAAQRSGIVPGISIIIQVRDCEFRLGRYNKALQIMESQFSSFCGSAQQRIQRIKREEADIASGRVKISPKEAQAKRVKDNRDHENIERARTRFSRVLEGLRTLIHLAPGDDPVEENASNGATTN